MDQRLRDLERQVRQGDASAALAYERELRRVEGPREIQGAPIYKISINTMFEGLTSRLARSIQGEIQITIGSDREIDFFNWQVPVSYRGGPPGSGGQENVSLHVNGIPYGIQFTYHNFEEWGWQPTSLARLQESQQERAERHRDWDLNYYLDGGYRQDDNGAHPNIYIRRMDRAFRYNEPTRNAYDSIMALGLEIAETWPQEHPEEMRLAHKSFLNNEIIAANGILQEIQSRQQEVTDHLASLILDDLD